MDTQLSSLHTRALFLMKPTMKVQRKIPTSYKPGYISEPFIIEQFDWISHRSTGLLEHWQVAVESTNAHAFVLLMHQWKKIIGGKLVLNNKKLVKLKLYWSLVAVYWVYRENGKFIDP